MKRTIVGLLFLFLFAGCAGELKSAAPPTQSPTAVEQPLASQYVSAKLVDEAKSFDKYIITNITEEPLSLRKVTLSREWGECTSWVKVLGPGEYVTCDFASSSLYVQNMNGVYVDHLKR